MKKAPVFTLKRLGVASQHTQGFAFLILFELSAPPNDYLYVE